MTKMIIELKRSTGEEFIVNNRAGKCDIRLHMIVSILNQLNEKEILYTSEVFEEIAYNLQSVNYINCLKYIEKKYPSLDIKDAIEVATEFI